MVIPLVACTMSLQMLVNNFFLRTLLTICKGCKPFEDVSTFDRVVYYTFKYACLARGLLEIDEEWSICLQEAAFQSTGLQLR